MKRICYVCQTQFGEKEPFDDDSETHGICDACLPGELEKIKRQMDQPLATIGHDNCTE